jgi:hypothetical protein
MRDLNEIAKDIRETIAMKQKEFGLTFQEEDHIYTMNGRTDYPSVSKVLKNFYTEFPTEEVAYNKSGGDPQKQEELIAEWAASGRYATNMGSRVHYVLEKKLIEQYDNYKDVREPIFECDVIQMMKSDSMISAGSKYLKLMKDREVVLLDTETVLGHPDLGYTGQPDKLWILENRDKSEYGLLITDWKTNKPKNFESNRYTKKMKDPFTGVDDTALGHYYVQLPLYVKLLFEMLKGTKYENMRVYGGIVVLLKDDSDFKEYRIPKEIMGTVLEMDISKYIKK